MRQPLVSLWLTFALLLAVSPGIGRGADPSPMTGSVENELKAIIAGHNVPADLTITYDDMHGLWGGTTIRIYGDGRMERQTKKRGSREAMVARKRVGRHKLIELARLLVRLKAWEQHTPDSQPVPDESRANLTISVKGSTSRVWERHNEMPKNDRLIRIKAQMEKL